MKDDKTLRTQLNGSIWKAARNSKTKPDTDDMIRVVREEACRSVTAQTRVKPETDYKLLTIEELIRVESVLKYGNPALNGLKLVKYDKKTHYATKQQLKKMHFIALQCAVKYVDCNVVIQVGEKYLSGEDLRKVIKKAVEDGNLSGSLQSQCYDWIVPKVQEFLKEGKFRYQEKPATSKFVKWTELTKEEANYIIIRFERMSTQITQRYTPPQQPNPSLN